MTGYLETDKFRRPILSEVLINQAKRAKYASEFETNTSAYVNLMFHELTHGLGALFTNYHHKNSTLFYSTKQNYCKLSKYGKNFSFITGPYSHLFAQKHYGVDVFVGDDNNCTSGIEIEDGGDEVGTASGHIKASRFYLDLNIGMSIQYFGVRFERIRRMAIQ